jgi:hypothetical protein
MEKEVTNFQYLFLLYPYYYYVELILLTSLVEVQMLLVANLHQAKQESLLHVQLNQDVLRYDQL